MINLGLLKSKLFLVIVLVTMLGLVTYKVYDLGYDAAVYKMSAQAVEAKERHDKAIQKLESNFAEREREFLAEEKKNKAEFDKKYRSALESVNSYVESNGYSDCNIGTDGVQRVNDLLRGVTTNDK